jgi:hypothetical protein
MALLKVSFHTQYLGYTETIKEINRGTLPAIMESMTANMVSEDPGLDAMERYPKTSCWCSKLKG